MDRPRATIIIFGAAMWPGGVPSPTLKRRVEAALRFGRTLDAPIYLPTGGVGRHGPSEASVMAAMLAAAGVSADSIIMEDTALDTTDSIFACRRLLGGRNGPVYACSSRYHLPRCVLLLRLAGVPARACPPLPEAENPGVRLFRWGREAAAIIYDFFVVLAQRSNR